MKYCACTAPLLICSYPVSLHAHLCQIHTHTSRQLAKSWDDNNFMPGLYCCQEFQRSMETLARHHSSSPSPSPLISPVLLLSDPLFSNLISLILFSSPLLPLSLFLPLSFKVALALYQDSLAPLCLKSSTGFTNFNQLQLT